jgi:F0F1-type ATP synthase membrane subunit b/b'
MDTIVIILKALKIDQTVLIQFGILFVFFNILAPLLFKRIQDILEYREGKTTKLESSAHAVYKQAEELANQYKARVEKTHADSQQKTQNQKLQVMNVERELLKSAEEKINTEYDERKNKILKELSDKRTTVMAEADKLAGSLVEKLTK